MSRASGGILDGSPTGGVGGQVTVAEDTIDRAHYTASFSMPIAASEITMLRFERDTGTDSFADTIYITAVDVVYTVS